MPSKPIRLRILVDPLGNEQSAFHCDIELAEEDIQALDTKHGFDDFIEKFIKPGLYRVLDQFVEPYTDVEDFMRKLEGRIHLPRSVEFYRQKFEMSKARNAV